MATGVPATPADQQIAETAAASLWDDNPAELDLLGFDAVAVPVLAALRQPDLDPITVGVHAPWGGGKSTLLNLLAAKADKRWIVVRTTPWEYEDQLDVKGTLIAEVLGQVKAEAPQIDKIAEKFTGLLKRVSWSRVGMAIAKGAVTMTWNPAEILKAFSLNEAESPQQSMANFRAEFADVLELLEGTDRVVVLVDDLDRCLPDAVVATLEAIKLFLSVKKMAFVIAADQQMVRDAIAASQSSGGRGGAFAERYLEKIVQLPVSLPRLAPSDSETYIALLLTPRTDAAGYEALVAHCAGRRVRGQVPVLDDLGGLKVTPSDEATRLAAQINRGLQPSKRGNPREIKRFLNAFGVRTQIAVSRNVAIEPAQMVKLMILEDRHIAAFERLAAMPEGERLAAVDHWEAWGRGDREDRPEFLTSDETKDWARSEPGLAGAQIDGYITLAATFAASSLGTPLSDRQRKLVRGLLDASDTARDEAKAELNDLAREDLRQMSTSLVDEARTGDADRLTRSLEALVAIAKVAPDLGEDVAEAIRKRLWSDLGSADAFVLASSEVDSLVELSRAIADDESLEADVRDAARMELEGK